jgi:hypothetical protein
VGGGGSGVKGFRVDGANGIVQAAASSNTSAIFNRTTTDGAIVSLRKNGAEVGSIGNASIAGLTFTATGGNNVGIICDGNGANIVGPWDGSSYRDNAINLGYSAGRWKDLYLSGGVYLGGTAAANQLDDYEEGTFTPTILFGGASAGVTYNTSFNGGHYTKIGNRVYVNGYLILSNKGSSTGAAAIGGLPFTSLNTTVPLSGFSAAALTRISGITFADQLTGVNSPNSSTIEFYETTNAGVETTLTDADFTNSSRIMFALTYQTTT